MANKDLPLTADIVGGVVTIRIGVSALCQVVTETLTGLADGDAPTFTDEYAFARGVLVELQRVRNEEGRTPIHAFFEHAAVSAAEAGSDGVRFPGEFIKVRRAE
ncbi:hypothetical protein [Methylobacterium sp. SyP6R]|uniref:hypothetical protein n=1 Tax=Methylobacterium sp. SyP6R TaxID=2718876 RepID=UPI001F31EE8E|nr:hypothetical protein [Methylobacterium sp. SyP6R]MCF4125024.1 hypothetical protein [Methylobacterium sp. SyP6R]